MSLHELGHFLLAKKFGIVVEEFGIGYPPRIWGKKIKDTIYSVNWLPLGAFVKILGEDDTSQKIKGSFSSSPLYQRILVVLGGCFSFWVIAFLIFTFLAGLQGVNVAVSDNYNGKEKPFVQIFSVAKNSPAEKAGIQMGDIMIQLKSAGAEQIQTDKVALVQSFIYEHKGEQIIITLKRGKNLLDVPVVPRVNPPRGEGALGVGLSRVINEQTQWYKAPYVGLKTTFLQTKAVPQVWIEIITKKIKKEPTPNVQFVGPVGLGSIMNKALQYGAGNYLMLIAVIAIYLAIFNLLPLPALDGGRLLFLVVEAIRKKPIEPKIEQQATAVFFVLFIMLGLFLTIQDIWRLF